MFDFWHLFSFSIIIVESKCKQRQLNRFCIYLRISMKENQSVTQGCFCLISGKHTRC